LPKAQNDDVTAQTDVAIVQSDDVTAQNNAAKTPARAATDIYISAMLLAFPLFTGLDGYRNLTRSKFLLFALYTAVWLLFLLACAVADLLRKTRRRGTSPENPVSVELSGLPPENPVSVKLSGLSLLKAIKSIAIASAIKSDPIMSAVAAFAFIAVVSAVFSPYDAKTVLLGAGRYDGLLTLLLYAAVFFGVSLYGRLRPHHIWLFAVSVTICCVTAVLQLFDLNPLWLFPNGLTYHDAHYKYTSEMLGTIGNANLLAAFLCLSAPLFAVSAAAGFGCDINLGRLSFRGQKTALRALLLIPCLLSLIVLAASKAAGGIVGVTAAVLFSLPVFLPMLARKPSLRRAAWLITACVIILGLALIYLYPGESGVLYEFSRILRGDFDDAFGSHRVQIWKKAAALIRENPFLGAGQGTMADRMDITFTRYVPETGITLTAAVDNSYNEFLEIWANIGIFGLLAYLAAIAFSLIRFYKYYDYASATPLILGMPLMCYWAQSFFSLGLCIVSPLMWLFWGLFRDAAKYERNCHNEKKGQAEPT